MPQAFVLYANGSIRALRFEMHPVAPLREQKKGD
jgi:hypothetical protein